MQVWLSWPPANWSQVALVLALLADTDAERERLITWARREAEQIVAAARSAARAITTHAAWRADTVREQAAQQVLTAARKQAAMDHAGRWRNKRRRSASQPASACPSWWAASSAPSGNCRLRNHERRMGRGQRAGQSPGPSPAGCRANPPPGLVRFAERRAAGAGRHRRRGPTSGRSSRSPWPSTRSPAASYGICGYWLAGCPVRACGCSVSWAPGSRWPTSTNCWSPWPTGWPRPEF